MTNAHALHHLRHTHPAVHFEREVLGGLTERHEIAQRDHEFALRNPQIPVGSTVDDAREAADIPSNYGIDDVSRQAGNVRHFRRLSVHSHLRFPQRQARDQNISTGNILPSIFRGAVTIRFRGATCSDLELAS